MKANARLSWFRALAVALAVWILAAAAPLRAEPLRMTFVNGNTTYGSAANAWVVFSYTGTSPDEFVGTVLGFGPKSGPIVFTAGAGPSAGSFFSEVFQITDLAGGVDVAAAPSTRIYVSLGRPLDASAGVAHPGHPFSAFGSPSPTDSSDPNWNVRWDFFETTLSDPRSANDYGDISAINQLAIPLRVEIYESATEHTPANLLQTAQTAADPATLLAQLTALADANLANNNFSQLAGNWFFETPAGPPTEENPFPGTFLRQVGPASAGTQPEWIGPFPSMNDYANFVFNAGGTPISTVLTDTTAVAGIARQTYTMTTTAAVSEANALTGIRIYGTVDTSTWNTTTLDWNTPTSDGKTYEMRIALDENVGQPAGQLPAANYSLSNALYGSAWQDNSGVSYWITHLGVTTEVTKVAFLASVSSNGTMALQTVNQWMQNAFVGYNFGLVGSPHTVSNLPAGNPYIGVTLNDMGSAGWAALKVLIDQGALSTSDVPFFTLTDGQDHPLYNQWAKVVFESSQTAYGTQYSDMFQPLLALYTFQTNFVNDVYQPTAHDVLGWKVTILPDRIVPEPNAIAATLTAFAILIAKRRARNQRRRIASINSDFVITL